jgi:hypothetical protein
MGTAADERAMDLRLGDDDDVYLCVITAGSLAGRNHGQDDFVMARYTRAGELLWFRRYGTTEDDRAVTMEVGEQGQFYVGGRTEGDLRRKKSQRGFDDARKNRTAP